MWISPGTPVGLLWTPGAGRAEQRAWHSSRSDAGAGNQLQPKGWASLLSHLSPQQSCKEPTSSGPACRDPGKPPSSLPVPRQPRVLPLTHCTVPALLVLGSPGWGEPVPPPRSQTGCTGRVSQSQPIPPRQAGVRCRFPWESPSPSPRQPRGLGGPGPACRPQLLAAMRRGRELGTAARRERPLRLRGCLGEPHTKPRLLLLPGDPCFPGSRHPEPDAGQGEPEVAAQGRALGLDGREVAGDG